jgi:hypothetical protein
VSGATTFDKAAVEQKILHRLNFEPSKGRTFKDLEKLTEIHFRKLDGLLQSMKRRKLIRFVKSVRFWVIA